MDHCLAAENFHGVLVGWDGAGNAVTTISNSTVVRSDGSGIYASVNGTVRAFANTVTNNFYGLNGSLGTFESAGHNMVRGNTFNTAGSIVSIPTM